VIIRRAVKEDYISFVEIEKQHKGFPCWSVAAFSKEEENPYSVTLAAEKEGKIVAFLNFHMLRPEVEINLIAVDRNFLRCGIATRLLAKLREYAKKSLCTSVILDVRADNAPALEFYKKEGFRVEGSRPKFYNDNGDALLMRAPVRKENVL
jgi:ribosomal-protein-alanine N-acetyltransferase